MGFLLLPIFIIYLLLALISIAVAVKFGRSKTVVVVVVLFFIIFPFRRLIFYKILFSYYSRSPLHEIHETVEYPLSVYWEDNVWPGFDAYGRHWMVRNYLDGEHLKMLALKSEDGKIYLYRANQKTFADSHKLLPEYMKIKKEIEASRQEAIEVGRNGGDNKAMWDKIRKREGVFSKSLSKQYNDQRKNEIIGILERGKVYADVSDLPPMRYHVEFNLLPKSFLLNKQNRILHADRISIVDMENGVEIAFSIRYMAYSWTMVFGAPPSFGYTLGDTQPYELDDKMLFGYAGVRDNIESIKARLERSSYNRRFGYGWERRHKKQGAMNNAR